MNAGHIIYPFVILIVVLFVALNRGSLTVRIIIVCLLTGFILVGLSTTPGANARSVIDTRKDHDAQSFWDGVIAAKDAIERGNWMLTVPIVGLALIALIPMSRNNRKSAPVVDIADNNAPQK